MDRSHVSTIRCACGMDYTQNIYESVNVTLEPRLLYTLLAGLLNVGTCPNCNRKTAVAGPFIYHDMKRGILAYVHPTTSPSEELKAQLLEKLQEVYISAVIQSSQEDEENSPDLQIVFGMDNLIDLISSTLAPEEQLGKLAFSTKSSEEERRKLIKTATEMASLMSCQVEAEEVGNMYYAWIYGSRQQIGAIMNELAPPA